MTDRQIISLLKRYMDGATTVEEETALAEFFCTATDADRPDAISAAVIILSFTALTNAR